MSKELEKLDEKLENLDLKRLYGGFEETIGEIGQIYEASYLSMPKEMQEIFGSVDTYERISLALILEVLRLRKLNSEVGLGMDSEEIVRLSLRTVLTEYGVCTFPKVMEPLVDDGK